MAKIDEAIIGYRVFENATEYLGIASVQLPNIEFFTTNIQGAGISGEIEEVILGHINAMRVTFNFSAFGENALALATPVDHNIDLREAQQGRNMAKGKLEIRGVKHVMTIRPISISMGTLQQASTSDPSGEYAVSYYAQYVGGEKVIEIDQLNYICLINGVDYLADVRAAMGL